MAVSFIDGATQVYETDTATGPVTSFTIPTPTDGGPLVAGDFVVAQFTWDTATDVPITRTLPSGWASFAGVVVSAISATTNIQTEWMYHLVTAAEASAQPSGWTLTTADPLDAGIAVERFRGVDPVDPIAVSTPAAGWRTQITATTLSTKTSPSVTTDTDGAMILISAAVRSGSQTLTSLTPASYTLGANTYALGARTAAWGHAILDTAGATPTATWTASSSACGAGFTTALKPSAGGPPPIASLVHRVVGIPSGTAVPIACRTTNAASVRVKVGTDSAVTAGVIFGSAGTPNARGDAQLTVTGLSPGTRYYYRIEMTPSEGGAAVLDTAATVGTFKTAPAGAASFAFDFGSCCNAIDSQAMAAIAARGDDLFFHLGDLYYADGTGTDLTNIRTRMTEKIQAANHAAVFATTATEYTPSDHDGMTNDTNAGSSPAAWTNWNAAYRELWPTLDLPGSGSEFSRVQFASGGSFTTGSATHTSGDLPTLPTPATAGNALIGMWSVDKNSGAFTPPAGWTVLGQIVGTSVSMLVCGKVAAGGETTATATWVTATEGHSAFLVEYTGTTASPFGPVSAPAYNDVARTSMGLGPVTATANSRAIAMFDIDSIRSGGAQLDFSPTAAGWRAASIGQAPQPANGVPGAALVESLTDTADGAVVPATTFSWTASDQVNGMMLLLNVEGTVGGPPVGVYRTFTWGRVRFIRLDLRSFATAPTATDNASKTQLGATQKQWLKDTITAATEPVIVILQENPWIGPATANEDNWMGYTTERTELANFFVASGKPIVMLAGDAHILAADNGSNAPGGITFFLGAPLHQTSSVKGGPYSAGTYPTSNGVAVESYGRVVVTDTGSQIALAYTGYTADNTARISLTKTVVLAAAGTLTRTGSGALALGAGVSSGAGVLARTGSGALALSGREARVGNLVRSGLGQPLLSGGITSRVKRWDGNAWVPALVRRWDGSAWVPARVLKWDGTAWV